jgi:hypothetical protein
MQRPRPRAAMVIIDLNVTLKRMTLIGAQIQSTLPGYLWLNKPQIKVMKNERFNPK